MMVIPLFGNCLLVSKSVNYLHTILISCNFNKVSHLGVVALWGDGTFIMAYWHIKRFQEYFNQIPIPIGSSNLQIL